MTAQWFEQLQRRVPDVQAHVAQRQAAYLDRWHEAGRFLRRGDQVLDLGGGNLYPALLQYLRSLDLTYHYRDIDPQAVAASAALAQQHGLDAARFRQGFNDSIDLPDASVDAVFSSHCIEHSMRLDATWAELWRVIRPGGQLLMAVPLGWEENPEHPYFFDAGHWVAMVEDAGFSIRVAQIGREYPEQGHDLFIAAQRDRQPVAPRIDPQVFRKETYRFIRHDDACVSYAGAHHRADSADAAHMKGEDWTIEVRLTRPWSVAWPVMARHDWSACIEVTSAGSRSMHDLFSWHPFVQPCLHAQPLSPGPLRIRPVGRHAASRATEGVFHGLMVR